MTTRATYQISVPNSRPITFYIHCDGYPQGAAHYFLKACLLEGARGGLAEQFLRANARAEFAGDHAHYGDTEYRYTVDGQHRLRMDARVNFTESWECKYLGSLADFIEAKTGTKLLRFQGRYMTSDMAGAHALQILERVSHALSIGMTGNASAHVGDARKLAEAYSAAFGQGDVLTKIEAAIEAAERAIKDTERQAKINRQAAIWAITPTRATEW